MPDDEPQIIVAPPRLIPWGIGARCSCGEPIQLPYGGEVRACRQCGRRWRASSQAEEVGRKSPGPSETKEG